MYNIMFHLIHINKTPRNDKYPYTANPSHDLNIILILQYNQACPFGHLPITDVQLTLFERDQNSHKLHLC